MAQLTFSSYFFLLVALNFVATTSISNFPDSTGGYTVLVAFPENTPEPGSSSSNSLVLIQNIKTSLSNFSEKLWEASRHQFYIKSVDILLPSTWTGFNSTNAVDQSFDTASIKISPLVQRPRSENPFPCGKPGKFIEFSLSFFNDSQSGGYGPNWKVLLNLWAVYRWGVYEEHGYVGDVKYPYTYMDPISDEWKITGCSDQPISGSYLDTEYLPCSASDTLNSSSTCRFIPDSSTNATTSLMHFHWIDSIVNFCDSDNHDKLSSNRQNALCDHKSVWEVIRETTDYKMVSNPVNSLPLVSFQVVQQSKKPSLYILLDRGSIEGSITLANYIPRAIIEFLGSTGLQETVAALGTFPDLQGDDASFKDEIEWSTLGDNLNKFADTIGNLRMDGPLQRSFPNAILTAVERIKAKSPPNGVVMLLVKYGADLSSFASYVPEPEVLNALNEQGIILNTIELRMSNHTGYAHLSELAKITGGVYTVISSSGEAQSSLSNFFWFMENILEENYDELKKSFQTLIKSTVSSGSITRFKVPKSVAFTEQNNPGKVEVYFSTSDDTLSSNNFSIKGTGTSSSETISDVVFRKRQDWQEIGSKWTYLLEMPNDKIANFSEVLIRMSCVNCLGSMLVRTDVISPETQNVTISAFLSAQNSLIDLPNNGPIIIFAKLFDSGIPVQNAQVIAHITDTSDSTKISSVHLIDNGEGTPDEDIFDGIYSGYFVPTRDGSYKFSISIESDADYTIKKSKLSIIASERYYTKLLPVDQCDMGCSGASCNMANLPTDFMRYIDLSTDLQLSGASDYIPEPSKISTFLVTLTQDPGTINMIWIAPAVPGTLLSVSSYDIRQSNSKESLITDFENQDQVMGVTSRPGRPGSVEQLQIVRPTETTFFAIRSVFNGKHSKISSVEVIMIREVTTSTTTPSSTQTTPSSSSPTTPSTIPTTPSTSPTTPSTTLTTPSTTLTTPSTTLTTPSTALTTPSTALTTPSTTLTTPSTTLTTPSTSPTTPSTILTTPSTTETTSSTDTPVPTNTTPSEDKPWAKTGGGIAVITISVIVAVIIIIAAAYFIWKRKKTSNTAKINPPPQTPRTSILL